jgi:hypothetical protein
MTTNPYTPPGADINDVNPTVSPQLWNPGAAVAWSLLFSPTFGALIQMKNWQALGEPEKARVSKIWAILNLLIVIGFSVFSMMLPENKLLDGLSRILGIVLLISWYVSNGREQNQYVKDRFGIDYPRKSWAKPLIFSVLVLVVFFAIIFVAAMLGVSPDVD